MERTGDTELESSIAVKLDHISQLANGAASDTDALIRRLKGQSKDA